MKKNLYPHEVVALARALAVELGVAIPPDERLMKVFNIKDPLPIVVQDCGYTVWLDKDYIAYIAPEEDEVRYVFVSDAHIFEEYDNHNYGKSGMKDPLPPEIRVAFHTALKEMRKTEKNYHIFWKEYSKYPQMIVNVL